MDSVLDDIDQPPHADRTVDDAAYAELERLAARAAGEWLTFERLCQEMRVRGAPDPRAFSATDRDVERAVLRMLHPALPAQERERTLAALLRALGGHPEIAPLRYLIKDEGTVATGANQHALQAMLSARDDVFAHWHRFKEGMERVEMVVCRVHVDRVPTGTGFLISDRHVLTTFHGVAALVDDEGRAHADSHRKLTLVFDDVLLTGAAAGSDRVEVAAAPDWLVSFSRFDAAEDSSMTPPEKLQAGLLDYAVIRLAEPIGNIAPKYQKGIVRNWIRLDQLAATPAPTTQMLLAHYPAGTDLRLCVGLFGDHSQCLTRVRYQTPTVVGSSGAPCFNIKWEPYALHNAGYPAVPINQGVPLELIRNALGPNLEAINGAARPRFIPAVSADGAPILGRPDVAEMIETCMHGRCEVSVLVITAGKEGGKSYTADLVCAALMGRGHAAFLLDAETFAADTPEMFARRLVETIAGTEHARQQPEAPDSRQRARWITRSLSEWTKRRALEEEQQRRQDAVPDGPAGDATGAPSLWILLDRCDKVVFTQETHDLLLALMYDEAGGAQPLRFMLFGYEGDLAAIPADKVWRTRLNLISATGALPFMEHTMAALGQPESSDTLYASAASLADGARAFGISTLPGFVAGLQNWAGNRKTEVARVTGAQQ